jgi:hypothetical protein
MNQETLLTLGGYALLILIGMTMFKIIVLPLLSSLWRLVDGSSQVSPAHKLDPLPTIRDTTTPVSTITSVETQQGSPSIQNQGRSHRDRRENRRETRPSRQGRQRRSR